MNKLPSIINAGVNFEGVVFHDILRDEGDLPDKTHRAVQVQTHMPRDRKTTWGLEIPVDSVEKMTDGVVAKARENFGQHMADHRLEHGHDPAMVFVDYDKAYGREGFWSWAISEVERDPDIILRDDAPDWAKWISVEDGAAWNARLFAEWQCAVILGMREAVTEIGADTLVTLWGMADAHHVERDGYQDDFEDNMTPVLGLCDFLMPHLYVGEPWNQGWSPRQLYARARFATELVRGSGPARQLAFCTRLLIPNTRTPVDRTDFEAVVMGALHGGAQSICIWEQDGDRSLVRNRIGRLRQLLDGRVM